MSSERHNEDVPLIKLICINLNPKTLPSNLIFSIYFTTTLCKDIKVPNCNLIEYNKTYNKVPLRINFNTFELSSASTQKQEMYMKKMHRANNVVIFIHLEKNVDTINELKNAVDFIKNDCEVEYAVDIVGFYKHKECIDDELEESKIKDTLSAIDAECEYEYREVNYGNKSDVLKAIDDIINKGYNNYTEREDDDEDSEEDESADKEGMLQTMMDTCHTSGLMFSKYRQERSHNDDESDNDEVVKDDDMSHSKCVVL